MMKTIREVKPAPRSLAKDGRCQFGTFNSVIENINILELDSPLGFKAPRWLNNFRLKEWQAAQISNDDWFICVSVYNTKSIGTAIIMAYNRRENKMYKYDCQALASDLHVPTGLQDSHCYFHGPKLSLNFYNRLNANCIEVDFVAKGFKDQPDISAQFKAEHRGEPIVIVQPFAENRPLYSHKALMPVVGELEFGVEKSVFSSGAAAMVLDDHKGYYPMTMQYDWVTGLGINDNGILQGFNLTDNQILEPEKYNENCLWHEGLMTPLPPVSVSRPGGVHQRWEISDEYGQVKLGFTPLADVPVKQNYGISKVDYHGPTGVFDGYIEIPSETDPSQMLTFNFDGFIGMGEKKYIRM